MPTCSPAPPGADLWTLRFYDDLATALPLTALDVELPLAEAYAAVVFGEEETSAPNAAQAPENA